ncbi:hydrophobin-315 [Coprinopsis sp. MPI-PUGE-AT-0042]|nr:hydrophobin-315 [Coprinopsis sp. MPI-PUGE-AT-0042]
MFARLSTVVLAFTLFAGALSAPTEIEYEQCNGGTVQCCNTTQDTKNFNQEAKGFLASLLAVDVRQITAAIGVKCTGVNVLAAGGGSTCTQQKVCCSNNNFNGVVALGCNPINVSV